jgi:tRNA1(Val) A37 N6-methylase TrmN6
MDLNRAAEIQANSPADLTDDTVLGGRLCLLQPKRGHRVGHDAILLAAATAAVAGERLIDLGAGVGAAGLAVAVRVPGTRVALVEIDPGLTALAAANAVRNGVADRVEALTLDVAAETTAFAAAGLAPGTAARVMMNPPFNDPGRLAMSPDHGRRGAHAGDAVMLSRWISVAASLMPAKGVLTLIHRADALAEVVSLLAGEFGALALMPVHPKPDAAAIRILVRAVKASRAPLMLLPSLVLNDAAGKPTPAAEAVLRNGEVLAPALLG